MKTERQYCSAEIQSAAVQEAAASVIKVRHDVTCCNPEIRKIRNARAKMTQIELIPFFLKLSKFTKQGFHFSTALCFLS